MVYYQVVYYHKHNRRGSSIRIDSTPMDGAGNIVVDDTEASISIIAPNGEAVVDGEPMSVGNSVGDQECFTYIWDTERDSATGEYGVEIEIEGADGKSIYYLKDLSLS